jgi:hypothetical protein
MIDGMILIGGIGIGVALWREQFLLYLQAEGWMNWLPPFVGFVLAFGSALMLAFRARRPRPSIRRISCQPGAVACFAMVTSVAALLADSFARDAVNDRLEAWTYSYYLSDQAFVLGRHYLLASVVVVCWSLLAMGRRWRPEPGWIDGIGRALGWSWIVWGFSTLILEIVLPFFLLPTARL